MTADSYVDVLLVEDDPDDAGFTQRALHKAMPALNVVRVDDGVKALNYLFGAYRPLAAQTPTLDWNLPRVVLLDLKMPKMDGLDVLKRIRSDGRTRRLPVVVLTSSREQRDIDDSYALGANSYIVKPVDYSELLAGLGDLARYWLQLNQSPTVRVTSPPGTS